MRLIRVLLSLLPIVLANPLAGPVADPLADAPPPEVVHSLESRQTSCTVSGHGGLNGNGNCQSVSSCNGVSVAGFCPGAANIQCCRWVACTGNKSNYFCRNTSKGCGGGGKFFPGLCPGDSSVQCCAF